MIVFPGFEAVSKEGVHLLCIFDPSTTIDAVQGRIHGCGIHDDGNPSPIGDLDVRELLERAPGWPAQVIAAHVVGAGGVFSPTFSTRRKNAPFFRINRPPRRLNKGTGVPKCL